MSVKPAILERLRGVQRVGGGWLAFCPAHSDRRKRSLSIAVTDDGKVLLKCFLGCPAEAITAAVGLTLADLFRDNGHERRRLTLDEFASAKGLSREFLEAHGIREDGSSLVITYRLRDGSLAPRQRRRSAIAAGDGSSWDGPRDQAPVAYGLWKLDEAVEKGEVLLVEGETDALTGWLHNVAVLGIPGADMTKVLTADALGGIERVWIIQEPDRGGSTFVAGCARRLAELVWSGEARVVRLPVKDLNDLHRMAGDGFADALARAQAEAVPLAAAGGAASPAEPADETEPAPAAAAQSAPPQVPAPTVERHGDEFILRWTEHGVDLVFTGIRESSDGLHAELSILREGEEVHWSRLGLASSRSRDGIVKLLERSRAASDGAPIPWMTMVDRAARVVADAVRRGEPAQPLRPRLITGPRYLVEPLLPLH